MHTRLNVRSQLKIFVGFSYSLLFSFFSVPIILLQNHSTPYFMSAHVRSRRRISFVSEHWLICIGSKNKISCFEEFSTLGKIRVGYFSVFKALPNELPVLRRTFSHD